MSRSDLLASTVDGLLRRHSTRGSEAETTTATDSRREMVCNEWCELEQIDSHVSTPEINLCYHKSQRGSWLMQWLCYTDHVLILGKTISNWHRLQSYLVITSEGLHISCIAEVCQIVDRLGSKELHTRLWTRVLQQVWSTEHSHVETSKPRTCAVMCAIHSWICRSNTPQLYDSVSREIDWGSCSKSWHGRCNRAGTSSGQSDVYHRPRPNSVVTPG